MLKVYTLAALLAMGGATAPLFAQEEVKNTTAVQSNLARGYIRPTLTVAYVTDGSEAALKALEELKQQSTEQFYYNQVSLPDGRLDIDIKQKGEYPGKLKEYAENLIKQYNVGQGIMRCWFPKFDEKEKSYSLDVLAERGAYGATDSDILTAEASKRGKNTSLMTLGERMIDRSYFQVVYISSKIEKDVVTTSFNSVLYKLDFGAEVSANFYEKGFDSANGISKVEFPVTFVTQTKEVDMIKSVKEEENGNGFMEKIMGMFFGMRCHDIPSTYDEMLTRLSQAHADFQVQSPIAEASPLKAKIGLKEGIKIDDRFYVMEQVLQSDGKTTKDVRRAVFRATKDIADNRKNADGHGKEYTTFYQVGGWNYDKGMTLVSKKDVGTSVLPLVSNNFVGAEIEQRISKLVKLPGTFVYARVGLPMGSKGMDGNFGLVTAKTLNDTPTTLLQFGLGVRKEFNFARMFNASAHVGFSGYSFLADEEKNPVVSSVIVYGKEVKYVRESAIKAYTLNIGGRFGVQVAPALGFFVGAEYGATLGEEASLINNLWGVSSISASLGARISF